jgi:hypothetical protein
VSGQKTLREIFVAETHLSAARAAPPQEARIPQTHEDAGWTESTCHTPQKRAPRPHARLTRRGWTFHAKLDWYGALNTTRCIAKDAAGAAANSRYSCAPMDSRSAGLAGASKRRWETRCGGIGYGGACAKFSGCTGGRFLQDGTLWCIRARRWRRRGFWRSSRR